ncbi:MAG: sulfite exporter TauE/SafE family protein [Nitrospirota bacterium]
MMLKKMYYLPGLVVVFASLLVSDALARQDAAAPKSDGKSAAGSARIAVQIDKTEYGQEATVKITGKAPKGKPVFIEVASEKTVAVRRLDSKRDKETGKIPYIFYTSEDVPAYYVTLIPKGMSDKVEALKAQKDEWSYSGALKDLGIDPAGLRPAAAKVERRKTSIIAVIAGSRGKLMEPLDEKGSVKSVLPLYKSRFKSPARLLKPVVDAKPDGSFEASLKLPKGIADGTYTVTAFTDKAAKTATSFTMVLPAGTWYFKRAGMAMNIFGPFIMALLVTMLGVLMGAGGGFILTPLLLWVYGLPHTIAAGTVLPTVLFSQMSGIYNYNKIKFISWKLGLTMGAAMLAGGFIGPVITQLISLSQYKSWFGGVLVILAGLMLWQTLPAQMARNKHEQEILKQFKKKAEGAKKK